MQVDNNGNLNDIKDKIERMEKAGINKLYAYSPEGLTSDEDFELQIRISKTIEQFIKEKTNNKN